MRNVTKMYNTKFRGGKNIESINNEYKRCHDKQHQIKEYNGKNPKGQDCEVFHVKGRRKEKERLE